MYSQTILAWLLLLYMWLNSMCRFMHKIWQLVEIFFMKFYSTGHIQQNIEPQYWQVLYLHQIKSCSWQVIGHRGSRCVGGNIPGARVSPGAPEPGENVVLPALSVYGNVWRRQQWKIRCHHNRKGKQWSDLYVNCVYRYTEIYLLIDILIYLLIALKSVLLWRNRIICLDCIQGRKNKKSTDMAIDWEVERENGVKTLLHLVSLNILRLWDPPIAEVEFVK